MATHIYTHEEIKELNKEHNIRSHCKYVNGLKKQSTEFKTWQKIRYNNSKKMICHNWQYFVIFLLDMGCKENTKQTIRRHDESLPYCKENCYWGFAKRTPRPKKEPKPKPPKKPVGKQITFNGLTMNVKQWEKHLGFKDGTLRDRFQNNWSIEKALTTPTLGPTERRTVTYTIDGKTFTIPQLAKEYNVSESAIKHRIKSGRGFADLIKPTLVERLPAPIVYIAKVFVQSKCYLKIGITYQTKQRFIDHKRNLNKIDAVITKISEYHLPSEQESRYIEKLARESLVPVNLGVVGFKTENYKWSEFDKLRFAAVMEVMIADALVY